MPECWQSLPASVSGHRADKTPAGPRCHGHRGFQPGGSQASGARFIFLEIWKSICSSPSSAIATELFSFKLFYFSESLVTYLLNKVTKTTTTNIQKPKLSFKNGYSTIWNTGKIFWINQWLYRFTHHPHSPQAPHHNPLLTPPEPCPHQ